MNNSAGKGGCYPQRICRILHILLKPNLIIALLFIQNILPFHSLFFHSLKITQSHPQVFSVKGSVICSGLHFLTSAVQ